MRKNVHVGDLVGGKLKWDIATEHFLHVIIWKLLMALQNRVIKNLKNLQNEKTYLQNNIYSSYY